MTSTQQYSLVDLVSHLYEYDIDITRTQPYSHVGLVYHLVHRITKMKAILQNKKEC